jgi:hypothetical protein
MRPLVVTRADVPQELSVPQLEWLMSQHRARQVALPVRSPQVEPQTAQHPRQAPRSA